MPAWLDTALTALAQAYVRATVHLAAATPPPRRCLAPYGFAMARRRAAAAAAAGRRRNRRYAPGSPAASPLLPASIDVIHCRTTQAASSHTAWIARLARGERGDLLHPPEHQRVDAEQRADRAAGADHRRGRAGSTAHCAIAAT